MRISASNSTSHIRGLLLQRFVNALGIRTSVFFGATRGLRNQGIYHNRRARRTECIRKSEEDNKCADSCHDDRVEQNGCKLLKERDDGEKHDSGRGDCREGSRKDRRTHAKQSVLGSLVTAYFAGQTAVGVSKMNDEIATDADQYRKTNRLEAAETRKNLVRINKVPSIRGMHPPPRTIQVSNHSPQAGQSPQSR